MSFNEIIILLIIALVLFGPDDLPDIARALGKVVREIKKLTSDMTKEFQEAVNTPSNMVKKTINDTLYGTPNKSNQETKKEEKEEKKETTTASTKEEAKQDKATSDNEEKEELLTYEDDPLAELPQDMVSYEKEK